MNIKYTPEQYEARIAQMKIDIGYTKTKQITVTGFDFRTGEYTTHTETVEIALNTEQQKAQAEYEAYIEAKYGKIPTITEYFAVAEGK